MKTRKQIQENPMKIRGAFFAFLGCLFLIYPVNAQVADSTQTLFRSNTEFSEAWAPELKVNSIQGKVGTLIGFYGGALINQKVLLGVSGGANLSHPEENYGYFGAIGQYIFEPKKLVHFSSQLLLAYGSTKDYENPKSGLFDNFWNISGTHFYMAEPGINLEINIRKNLTFCAGMSYRFVTGLDEDSEYVSKTHVTNSDMCGLNFNFGFKIGKKNKNTNGK
jgi:hypothetical protein